MCYPCPDHPGEGGIPSPPHHKGTPPLVETTEGGWLWRCSLNEQSVDFVHDTITTPSYVDADPHTHVTELPAVPTNMISHTLYIHNLENYGPMIH